MLIFHWKRVGASIYSNVNPLYPKSFCKVWLKSAQWFRRRRFSQNLQCIFNIMLSSYHLPMVLQLTATGLVILEKTILNCCQWFFHYFDFISSLGRLSPSFEKLEPLTQVSRLTWPFDLGVQIHFSLWLRWVSSLESLTQVSRFTWAFDSGEQVHLSLWLRWARSFDSGELKMELRSKKFVLSCFPLCVRDFLETQGTRLEPKSYLNTPCKIPHFIKLYHII